MQQTPSSRETDRDRGRPGDRGRNRDRGKGTVAKGCVGVQLSPGNCMGCGGKIPQSAGDGSGGRSWGLAPDRLQHSDDDWDGVRDRNRGSWGRVPDRLQHSDDDWDGVRGRCGGRRAQRAGGLHPWGWLPCGWARGDCSHAGHPDDAPRGRRQAESLFSVSDFCFQSPPWGSG